MGRLGDLKAELIRERGYFCEVCHERRAVQCSHVFFNTDKDFLTAVTVRENCALVCLICHGFDEAGHPDHRRVDTPDFREEFMAVQVLRYGREAMLAFLDGIPPQKKRARGSEYAEAFRYLLAIPFADNKKGQASER